MKTGLELPIWLRTMLTCSLFLTCFILVHWLMQHYPVLKSSMVQL